MTVSVKSYLKTRTLLLIGLFLCVFTVSIFSSAIMIFDHRLDSESAKLEVSSRHQALQLTPSVLIPEQREGAHLLISQIARQELLDQIALIAPEKLEALLKVGSYHCKKSLDVHVCKNMLHGIIATFTPIFAGDTHLLLYKRAHRTLALSETLNLKEAQTFLAISLLLFSVLIMIVSSFTEEIADTVELLKVETEWHLLGTSDFVKKDYAFLEFSELAATNEDLIDKYKKATREAEAAKISHAIAQTTQMLAHDVRKPFSMLYGVLSLIQNAKETDYHRIVTTFLPEVEKAMESVNYMITDIMQVGSNEDLNIKPFALSTLVAEALNENLRDDGQPSIDIVTSFKHEHLLLVDPAKMARVFSNLVGNAIQAMGKKGKLWVNSRQVQDKMEITVGNSNSYIAPEIMPRLFDMFFTSGKRGGTGIGLAIVKKIVNAHGGDIWCTSSPDIGTEFHFTLPTAVNVDTTSRALPDQNQFYTSH